MPVELTTLSVETVGVRAAQIEFGNLATAARASDASFASLRASLARPLDVSVGRGGAELATLQQRLALITRESRELRAEATRSNRTQFFQDAQRLARVDLSRQIGEVRRLAAGYGTLAAAIERSLRASQALSRQAPIAPPAPVVPETTQSTQDNRTGQNRNGVSIGSGSTNRVAGIGITGRGVAAGAAVGLGFVAAAESIRAINAQQELRQRLALFTETQREANEVAEAVTQIAIDNQQALSSVSQSYTGVARALQRYNIAAESAVNLTDAISTSSRISGGNAESQAAAIRQLSQAFSSGELRGEELRSVLEQAPRLAEAIAAGLSDLGGASVEVGDLLRLGEQGLLRAVDVQAAIRSQASTLAAENALVESSISQTFTGARTQVGSYVAAIDEAIALSSGLATVLGGVLAIAEAIANVGSIELPDFNGDGESQTLGGFATSISPGNIVNRIAESFQGDDFDPVIAAVREQVEEDVEEVRDLRRRLVELEAEAQELSGPERADAFRGLLVALAQQEAALASARKGFERIREEGQGINDLANLQLPSIEAFDVGGVEIGSLEELRAALLEEAALSDDASAFLEETLSDIGLRIERADAQIANATEGRGVAAVRDLGVQLRNALQEFGDVNGEQVLAEAEGQIAEILQTLEDRTLQLEAIQQRSQAAEARNTFDDEIRDRESLIGLTREQLSIEERINAQRDAVGDGVYSPEEEAEDRARLVQVLFEETAARAELQRLQEAQQSPVDVSERTTELVLENARLIEQIELGRELTEVEESRRELLQARIRLGEGGLTEADELALQNLQEQVSANEELSARLREILGLQEQINEVRNAPTREQRNLDRLLSDNDTLGGGTVDARRIAGENPGLDAFDLRERLRTEQQVLDAQGSIGSLADTEEGQQAVERFTESLRARNEAEREFNQVLAERDFADQFAESIEQLDAEIELRRELQGLNEVQAAGQQAVFEAERAAREANIELTREEIRLIREKAEQNEEEIRQAEVSNQIASAGGSFVRDLITDYDNAGEALENFGRRLADLVIELLVIQPLVESLSETGFVTGLASIFTAETGGNVAPTNTYLVGERGAETFQPFGSSQPIAIGLDGPGLFRPPTAGYIVPNQRTDFPERPFMQPDIRNRRGFMGSRMGGGFVAPGGFYEVGENGPEFFIPQSFNSQGDGGQQPNSIPSPARSFSGRGASQSGVPIMVVELNAQEAQRRGSRREYDDLISEQISRTHSASGRAVSNRQQF